PIAVPAIGRSQADDRCRQRLLVIADHRLTTLRRAWLTDQSARPALRDIHPGANMRDTVTAAGRAQYFPSRASLRINLPSVSSNPALRSRSFSPPRPFSRLA